MKIFLYLLLILLITGCTSTPPANSPTEDFQDYLNAGKFHFEHHQYAEAEKNFTKALTDSQTTDNLYVQAVSLLSLSQVMIDTREEDSAATYFNKASEIIPLIRKEQPDVSKYYLNLLYGQYYEILAHFEVEKGNVSKGIEYLELSEKYYQGAIA